MRIRLFVFVGLLCCLAGTSRAENPSTAPAISQQADGALAAYVSAPDPVYGWVEQGRTEVLGIQAIELRLTSQTWRGTRWKHRLIVLLPPEMTHSDRALLFINGGSWRPEYDAGGAPPKINPSADVIAMAGAAKKLSCPIAVLSQVPFQPMFDGKKEDELIAYTFDQYLTTGDPTWPLLLPMTKSAVRAMDAVQDFLHQKESLDVKSFTVTGASKRGWTTWLTAAVDPRVSAAAPMVIDMLNMGAQAKHQMDVWGEYSEQVHDYTALQIPQRMSGASGAALQRIVDPFSYRTRLTQPKLIFLGTNDPYWPVDSSSLYWEQLSEPKFLTIVPNAGHNLDRDAVRILGGLIALHQFAAGERVMPKMSWQFAPAEHAAKLVVQVDTKPDHAFAWIARAPSRDFRKAVWNKSEMTQADGSAAITVNVNGGEYVGLFGEMTFGEPLPLYLTTNVRIFGGE